MNIPKAIEILDGVLLRGTAPGYRDESDAIRLGQEALKRIEHDRSWGAAVSRKPLPGETED